MNATTAYYPATSAVQASTGLLGKVYIWATAILISCIISGAWNCMYEAGQLPFKPRDATLGLSALSLLLVFFNRPALNPATLLFLLLPAVRMFDAAFLKRHMAGTEEMHGTMVFTLISMFIIMLVIVGAMSTEHWRGILLRIAVITILIGTGSILYESTGGAAYSSIPGRPSGFLRQPNDAIIILCLMLGMILTLNSNFWWNALMIGISAIGVGVTLSRSGMLVFGVIVMTYMVMNLFKHGGKIALVIALAIPAAGAGVAALSQSASSRNFGTDKNAKERIEAIFGGSTDKMESGERMKDLMDGWEAVTDKPMLGWGTAASSTKWMPHNLWVALWLDLGVAGALTLAFILLGLTALCFLAKGQGIYALLPLWLLTLFSQNLADMPGYWLPAFLLVNLLVSTRIKLVLKA
jgi:hypothetical protein